MNEQEGEGGLSGVRPEDLLSEPPPSPEDVAQAAQAIATVREALDALPEDEQTVLRLRFGIDNDEGPMTLARIGVALPKSNGQPRSGQRIRIMVARAMDRMSSRRAHSDKLYALSQELPGTMPWRAPAAKPPPTAEQQRATAVSRALSSLSDYIDRWAKSQRRPGILQRWVSICEPLGDELRYDEALRGVRAGGDVTLEFTRDVGLVARWAERGRPKVPDQIRALADEPVFFVLLDDGGLETFRTGLPWNNGEEEQ